VAQAQAPTFSGVLVARTLAPPGGNTFRRMREELWRTDPRIALGEARTLESATTELIAGEQVMAITVLFYAAVALLITLISVYAVVAHAAVRHRREHGIRLALGASPARLVRDAMWDGLRGALIGLGTGVTLAAGLARLLSGFLYGIEPLEPSVFGTLPVSLLFLLLLAAYLPARRASRTDPAVVLRA